MAWTAATRGDYVRSSGSKRCDGSGMGADRAVAPGIPARRSASDDLPAAGGERGLLPSAGGLPVADAAEGFPAAQLRAANALNLSVSGVSRHLMNLEARLGARLVHRSTRQLSLTGEGEHLHADARDLLATWEEAEAGATARSHAPSGRLRIGASLTFSLLHLRARFKSS